MFTLHKKPGRVPRVLAYINIYLLDKGMVYRSEEGESIMLVVSLNLLNIFSFRLTPKKLRNIVVGESGRKWEIGESRVSRQL